MIRSHRLVQVVHSAEAVHPAGVVHPAQAADPAQAVHPADLVTTLFSFNRYTQEAQVPDTCFR